MTEWIANFLLNIFKSRYLATVFTSAIPLIELKGAIPLARGLFKIELLSSAGLSYLGSTAAGITAFLILTPLFSLLKRINFVKRPVEKVEAYINGKAEKISAKTQGKTKSSAEKIKFLSLFLFVAVPFPVTGVWTGAAIAVFLGMKFTRAVPALALGNLVAGAIITLLTFLFEPYVDIIIYSLLAIVVVMLVVTVVRVARAKPENEKGETDEENGKQSL